MGLRMRREAFTAAAPGRLVQTLDGQCLAFVPDPLPADLPLAAATHELHAEASLAVGELRGIGRTLLNPCWSSSRSSNARRSSRAG